MGPNDKSNDNVQLVDVSTAETEDREACKNGGGKAPKQSTSQTRGTTIPYQRGTRSIPSIRTSRINNNNTASSSRMTSLNSRRELGSSSRRPNQGDLDADKSDDNEEIVVVCERPVGTNQPQSVVLVDLTTEIDASGMTSSTMATSDDNEEVVVVCVRSVETQPQSVVMVDLTTESDDENVMEVEPTRMQLEVEEDREGVAGPSSSPPLTGIYMVD